MNSNHNVKLCGIFISKHKTGYGASLIFDHFKNINKIFSYEIVDENSKEQKCLMTFFVNNKEEMRTFKYRPVTLNRRENNIFFTINGLNNYFAGKDISLLDKETHDTILEENKGKKLNTEELGKDILLTVDKNDLGYKITPIKLYKVYSNEKEEKVN